MTPTATVNQASAFSRFLLGAFSACGVKYAVLSPGSRSQALALELAHFAEHAQIDLLVRIDERVAGFTALGCAVESGDPVIVVTTSGTAVANLFPAILEASHSGVPLIVITADRPAESRGTASNQTTWQPDIFGRFVRFAVDVDASSLKFSDSSGCAELVSHAMLMARGTETGNPGPVHLNVQFREPLSGTFDSSLPPRSSVTPAATQNSGAASQPLLLERGPRTLIIAGHAAGEAAQELAYLGGWPLIAEPSSGSRFGPNLIVSYRELLSDPLLGGRVERVVVFGHPTLSREVPELCTRSDVHTIVVTPAAHLINDRTFSFAPDVFNPHHRVAQFVREVSCAAENATDLPQELGADDLTWFASWRDADRQIRSSELESPPRDTSERNRRRAEFAALKAPVTRKALVLSVWNATWPHDRLVLGASRLIREMDRTVPGKKIRVHANRGLAGIDGTLSTALGIALASQESGDPGITRLLLGDVSVLHDVGALLLGVTERRPRIQVIVGNDGGGTIFDTLEVAQSADSQNFDRVLFTPHSTDFDALAAAYGWSYQHITTQAGLDRALSSPCSGPTFLDVSLQR